MTNKKNILKAFETDLSDPGSIKSGEYLEEHILMNARRFLIEDRQALIEVLQHWLSLRSEPKTMLAVVVTRELKLIELKSQLEELKKEVQAGKVFLPFYADSINEALAILGKK